MIHLICPNPAVDRTILVENFTKDFPNRPIEVKDFPGGKSFNVAYALQLEEHSETVVIHTMLGGQNGKRVKHLAKQKGYEIQSVAVEKNTRECNIIVDVDNKELYPIYEHGFTLTQDILDEFTEQLVKSVKPDDVVVFSGSLMQGMPDDYIAQVQNKINDPSVKFIVDTSGSALQATYNYANPYLIKINDEEFNDLFPTENYTTKEEIANALNTVEEEIPYFIITLGANGALARINGVIYSFTAVEIDVKNPVASGDHFLGNLVRGVVNEDEITDTIKKSIAYSSSNCTYWYPHIELEDVQNYISRVEVTKY